MQNTSTVIVNGLQTMKCVGGWQIILSFLGSKMIKISRSDTDLE